MTPKELRDTVIIPSYGLLPAGMNSREATMELIAIALQETKIKVRRQLISKVIDGKKRLVEAGPAVSFWQFERGGITGVMNHAKTRTRAIEVCMKLGVPFDVESIWTAMQTNDLLGAAFARLLLSVDSRKLPGRNDPDMGWKQYIFGWQPGKPHPETWQENFHVAGETAFA